MHTSPTPQRKALTYLRHISQRTIERSQTEFKLQLHYDTSSFGSTDNSPSLTQLNTFDTSINQDSLKRQKNIISVLEQKITAHTRQMYERELQEEIFQNRDKITGDLKIEIHNLLDHLTPKISKHTKKLATKQNSFHQNTQGRNSHQCKPSSSR